MSMTTETSLANEFVGRPFSWHGRGPDAYDCWGLVRACLLRSGMRDVPDYRSATEGAKNAVTVLDAMASGWEKLARPEPGCVVLLKMDLAVGTHVGYMLTSDRFLHTTAATNGAVVEQISSPVWRRRVVGFYRWRGGSRIACPVTL